MRQIMSSSKYRLQHYRLLVMGMVLGSLLASGFKAPLAARPLRVGDHLPTFQTQTIDGKTISSAGFKNRPLWLVFFMST